MTTPLLVCVYLGRAEQCRGCGGINEAGMRYCSGHLQIVDKTATPKGNPMVRKTPVDPAAVAACRALVYRLINRRTELGLSQRDLARRLDWPQSRVSDLERGKVVPSVAAMIWWSGHLDVDLFADQAEVEDVRATLVDAMGGPDMAPEAADLRSLAHAVGLRLRVLESMVRDRDRNPA